MTVRVGENAGDRFYKFVVLIKIDAPGMSSKPSGLSLLQGLARGYLHTVHRLHN